ncbi:MAG: hypothetical protein HPY58_13785 [Firmicutes bacterium]|nr:hypothetical protein [Bacillota bacterium]
MAVLAGFLALLGLAGVVVALVMLIVQSVSKRGWTKKRIWTVGTISLALFVIGVVMGVSSVPDGYEAGQQAARSDETVSISPASSPVPSLPTSEPAQKDQQPANSPKKEQNPSPTTDKTAEENFIPGLAAADIKLNLERTWGLKFSGPQIGQDLAEDSGEAVDPDTGVKLICNIFETSPLHIQWVDFVIDASSVAGLVSEKAINAVTEGYFGFCATLPYNESEPAKAKQWVSNNVRKATKAGNVISIQIGPAKFEMFGTMYFRTLRVKPAAE